MDLPERPRQPDIPRVDVCTVPRQVRPYHLQKIFLAKVFPGTGFVLEQLQGDASKTLATFFGNVCMLS